MKISIVTPNFPPENGAASSRIFDMALAMKDAGAEVEVLSVMPNYPQGRIFEGYQNKLFYTEILHGILVKRFWMYPSHSEKTMQRLLSMGTQAIAILAHGFGMLRKSKRPNILFIQSPPLPLAFSGLLLAKLFNIKLVANFSDIWPQAIFDLGYLRKGFIYSALHSIEKAIYRRADLCVGQSEEIIAYIEKHSGKPALLYRTGANTELFFPAPNFPQRSSTLKIVYAGLLGVAQGMFELCENINFAELGAELHIYGAGNEKDAIGKFIDKKPNRGIVLHDWVSANEVPLLLKTFDAALVAQKAKVLGTFPSKIYEAAATGLPVLLISEGEAALMVRQSQIGLVSAPGKLPQLAQNIRLLKQLTDEEFFQMRTKARSYALEHFDRRTYIRALIEKIWEMVEGGH